MRYLDLHNHPYFKPVFSENVSPWDEIEGKGYLVGEIIRSQGNLRQIAANSGSNLICISLYAPEVALIDNLLVKLAPLFTDVVDAEVLKQMANQTFDYHEEIVTQKKSIDRRPKDPAGIIPVVDIKSWKDYQTDDPTKIYVFYSVEGGHAFYGPENDDSSIDLIIERLENFTGSKDYLVTYITPCHLTHNIFMNQAFGIKILGNGEFIPLGFGINSNGWTFMNRAMELQKLIDVKHMSLVSRQQFYKRMKGSKTPIVCSHAGVTGISWEKALAVRKKTKGIKTGSGFVKLRHREPNGILKNTYFNPCSINIYDEDIIAILSSGGIIGISMDVRIIGGSRNLAGCRKKQEIEFVSSKEFEEWKKFGLVGQLIEDDFDEPYPPVTWTQNKISEDIWDLEDRFEEMEELNSFSKADIETIYSKLLSPGREKLKEYSLQERPQEHLAYFVNQLFQIVRTAEAHGITDSWKQVNVGSDFDGLIDALDCCKDAGQIGAFANMLIMRLPSLAKQAKITLPAYPVEQLVEDIVFNNAFTFFKKYF